MDIAGADPAKAIRLAVAFAEALDVDHQESVSVAAENRCLIHGPGAVAAGAMHGDDHGSILWRNELGRKRAALLRLESHVLIGKAVGWRRGKELPDTEVIALTSLLDDTSVVRAVKAGAIGYLLKDTQADELLRAIKAAASGQVQLSPQAAAKLMREIRAPDSPEALSEREIDVLKLLAQGKANKEIARDLVLGEKTIKSHVSNILFKLGVQSRTQAAIFAAQKGLVELGKS